MTHLRCEIYRRYFDQIKNDVTPLSEYKFQIGDWISRRVKGLDGTVVSWVGMDVYFQHHGIVTRVSDDGEIWVTQFNREEGHTIKTIYTCTLKRFMAGDTVLRVYNHSAPRDRDVIVNRILALIRRSVYHNNYDLETNNCEHFVTHSLFGVPRCHQLEMVSHVEKMILKRKSIDEILTSLQNGRMIPPFRIIQY